MTMQAIDINNLYRGMAPDLLYQSWRERLSGNPRLNMPSFADALNRIGFFFTYSTASWPIRAPQWSKGTYDY